MTTVQKYICDSVFCKKESGKHVLAIIRNEQQITERDIKCTDSIERFYCTDTECGDLAINHI